MRTTLPILLLLAAVLGCVSGRPVKEYKNKISVVNEEVVIRPGGWHTWRFSIKEEGARINGSYSTEGGADQEVLFYVADPEYIDSLQKNQTGRYHFKSIDSRANTHMTSVTRQLDPGDYYVLFHNESKLANRTVRVRMFVEW